MHYLDPREPDYVTESAEQAEAGYLAAQVWCECGHISGHHGIKPPFICATGGHDGCDKKCQGFKAQPTLICDYCCQPIAGDAQEHVQRYCEEYAKWALSGYRGLTVPSPCRYRIGEKVKWRGQQGGCEGIITAITRPENSDYVLWIGDFPLNEKSVTTSCTEGATHE